MINRTVLIGRLTKDVDLRYTQSGIAAGSFTLAVSRPFKNAQGERESDFINCVIWRKSAENFSNFTHKGSLVGIEGRIQTRNYENQQGQRVYVTEVVVDNFSLLESRNASNTSQHGNESGQQPANSQQRPTNGNYNAPASTQNSNFGGRGASDPFANNNGQPIDISDDDLPF